MTQMKTTDDPEVDAAHVSLVDLPGGIVAFDEHSRTGEDRLERARVFYERAVFGGDPHALTLAEHDLNAVEADLALARGRLLHARFLSDRVEDPRELMLFERAAELFAQIGDPRGEGEALFWIGIVHQVVRDQNDPAVAYFERARALATECGDKSTLSYAVRHLGFAQIQAGDLDRARVLLEESVRLRREIAFAPGVAAGLLALADLAAQEGDRDNALRLLAEAHTIAEDAQAHAVIGWINQTRDSLNT